MSPSLPIELKALIVAEICRSEPRGITLSSLSLAWPDIIPFLRERRFNAVVITSEKLLTDFLDITDGAPEIFIAIRSMEIMLPFNFKHVGRNSVIHLISNAVNLENLTLRSVEMDWSYTIALRTCTRLTALSLVRISVETMRDLFHVLSSTTRLTAITLHRPRIGEFLPRDFTHNGCPPFLPTDFNFDIPKPISQISSLWLDVGRAELPLLDLVSSPMTPFPDLLEISFSDADIRGHGPHRLPALLDRYHSSLRVLDLRSELIMELATLALPPFVEHLKFDVREYTSLRPICYMLLSGKASLKFVTLRLYYGTRAEVIKLPLDAGLLDEVLAGLDLECLNEEIIAKRERFQETVKGLLDLKFPRCSRLRAEDRLRRNVRWVLPEKL